MANAMNVPVLGIVENMSWVECPDCGKRISIYGESKLDGIAQELGLPILGRMPIQPAIADLCDKGEIERFDSPYLEDAVAHLETFLKQAEPLEA